MRTFQMSTLDGSNLLDYPLSQMSLLAPEKVYGSRKYSTGQNLASESAWYS